jgi:protein tyrosine/serine phosphatase
MSFFERNKWIIVGGLAFLSVSVLTLALISRRRKNKRQLDPQVEDAELSKKYNFHLIPDGLNNYRSAQITIDDYPYVIKKYGIKNIVRLNGDGNDSKHKSNFPPTSIESERQMCEKEGCNFQFVNAHLGYQEGKGYQGTLEKVLPILEKGNTLVHCTHGADRTGYVVASHLKKQNIITDKDKLWDYTTQYNSWRQKINNGEFFGSGYDKYADAFYPITELKNSKWV